METLEEWYCSDKASSIQENKMETSMSFVFK